MNSVARLIDLLASHERTQQIDSARMAIAAVCLALWCGRVWDFYHRPG
jgi:hypothetical protein